MLSKKSSQILLRFVKDRVEQVERKDLDIFQDDFTVDNYGTALLNAVKLWLLSSRWDRVRQPGWAGFFDDRLRRYPFTDAGKQDVEKDLMAAIKEKIADAEIYEVSAEPKLLERGWEVGVSAWDRVTTFGISNKDKNTHVTVLQKDDVNIKSASGGISL